MNKNIANLKGLSILLVTAFIWGIAFTAQSAGSEHLGGFSYTAIRFTLGVILLIPIMFIIEKTNGDKTKIKRTATSGLFCGLFLFCATILQQFGIAMSHNSGKAGFITCLYILIVPIFGLFARRFPSVNVWFGVALGLVGMYLLTVKENSAVETGDILVMLSAVFFAVHILTIDKFASDIYAVRFSVIQFSVVAVLSTVCLFAFEDISVENIKSAWLPLIYGGFGSVGIAYTLQTVGQKYAEPISATLVLSLESVFAAIGGALIMGERLEVKGYIGCALIFVGIISAQLPSKYFKYLSLKKEKDNG